MDSFNEFERYPGGFIDAKSGKTVVGSVPASEDDSTDGIGAIITTEENEVELLMFPMLDVSTNLVVMRASIQSDGPGAAIALAVLDGSMDGSIATNIPANSQLYEGTWKRMMLAYDPPGNSIVPIFQVANTADGRSVKVYLDNLEIYLVPRTGDLLNRLLDGKSFDDPPTVPATDADPTILRVFPMDSFGEFGRYPGGFIDAESGETVISPVPASEDDSTDGTGAIITTGRDQVELLLFPTIDVGTDLVLLRASVQSDGPGAAIALAVLDGSMDGSIATNIPANSQLYQGAWQRMMLVYDPPGNSIVPIFQVANTSHDQPVNIYLDNVEVSLIPRTGSLLNRLLAGESLGEEPPGPGE